MLWVVFTVPLGVMRTMSTYFNVVKSSDSISRVNKDYLEFSYDVCIGNAVIPTY